MREIKFRVILLGGTWHYFDCIRGIHGTTDNHFIPETIGQYTGLKDKNGGEIYEGDVVEWQHLGAPHRGVVSYEKHRFAVSNFYIGLQDDPRDAFSENIDLEIIGNIHDNPELLKGEMK